jgi:hypothetical protein
MNKSKRIYVDIDNPEEKNIKINLEQNTDTLEILSLKISQKEAYQFFNADYGVLVGRVIANGGVGVPNAKVSIFIPLTDEDQENSEIRAIYPYRNPREKNSENKRYNLLPRVAQIDPETGAFKPRQPFGSFPTKEEVLTNETWLEVYGKYYKYSTVTNDAGDYMLFGVPTGVQTVHMSVDITDIGPYSMSPADMIVQLGYSDRFFNADLTIKEKNDLEDLPHIETQEISVDVIPYWGDSNNFQIGITRQDFRIRAELVNNFVVFGSYFTHGRLSVNGDPDRANKSGDGTNNGTDLGFYRLSNDYWNNVDFRTNRIGDINIQVFTYLPTVSKTDIDNDIANSGSTINPQTDIALVDPNSYYEYKENGMFVLSIPCNRRKIITDQLGNQIEVSDSSSVGIFTEFLGMFIVEHENIEIDKTYERNWKRPNSPNNARLRFKIPQDYFSIRDEENSQTGSYPNNGWANTVATQKTESEIWRKKYFQFRGGEYYSIAQFFPTKFANDFDNPDTNANSRVNSLDDTIMNFTDTIGMFKVGGTVRTTQEDLDNFNIISGGSSGGTITGTTFIYDFPYNAIDQTNNNDFYFGAQWINFNMYFPQFNWTFAFTSGDDRNQNTADVWWKDYFEGRFGERGEWFTVGNSLIQNTMGGFVDTRYMASAHALRTDFVKATREDIVNFASINRKGLKKEDENLSGITLTGEYKYLPPTGTSAQFNYGEVGYDQFYNGTANPHFFKGMYDTDCVQLLFDLNFI